MAEGEDTLGRTFYRLLILLALPVAAWGQGTRVDGVALGPRGPIANPTVTVCTSAGQGTPCTPLALTPATGQPFTNQALTVAAANPLPVVPIGAVGQGAGVDALGNYGFWAQPGTHVRISITGPGVATPLLQDVTLSCDPTQGCTFTGPVTLSGGGSFSGTYTGNPTLSGTPDLTASPTMTCGNAGTSACVIQSHQNNDALFGSLGYGDVHLRDTPNSTTSTTSVSPGTSTITVGSTTGFSTALSSSLQIQYDLESSWETVTTGNWSIVDGTHFQVTFAKSHTQPYNVSQYAPIVLESDLMYQTNRNFTSGLVWYQKLIGNGNPKTGIESGNAALGVQHFRDCIVGTTCDFIPRYYGRNSAGGGLVIYGSDGATGSSRLISFSTNDTDDPTGANSLFTIDPSSGVANWTFLIQKGTPALSGQVRLNSNAIFKFRNNANSADISGLTKNASDVVILGDTAGAAVQGPFQATLYQTAQNCAVNSVSPAACSAAPAGAFVVPTTTTTYTVNTTVVTVSSRIFLFPTTDASNLPSSPTCVAPAAGAVVQSARVAGTSFTFTLPSTTGTTCWNFWIVD